MKVGAIISLVMSIIFIVLGIIIPFYPPPRFAEFGIKGGMLYVVAVLLISYGLFRLNRAYRLLKQTD